MSPSENLVYGDKSEPVKQPMKEGWHKLDSGNYRWYYYWNGELRLGPVVKDPRAWDEYVERS